MHATPHHMHNTSAVKVLRQKLDAQTRQAEKNTPSFLPPRRTKWCQAHGGPHRGAEDTDGFRVGLCHRRCADGGTGGDVRGHRECSGNVHVIEPGKEADVGDVRGSWIHSGEVQRELVERVIEESGDGEPP